MAYAALVSLEHTIHRILNQDRYSTSPQEKHHIVSIDKHVVSFQAFLEDFPEEAKKFEAQIRDAATEAEDIIECFMLDQIRGSCGCIMWIDTLTGIKFEYELNKVAEKMEAIAPEVVEIKDSAMIKDVKLGDASIVSSSSAIAPAGKIDVVGFEEDLLEIKDQLAGNSFKLQYLAISGMGGIGKTTLARSAYDDQLIQEHFDILAWVTISQDYRAQEILSCLLDSMREFEQKESKESIKVRVYKILKGRRYLIVMDDVWSTEVLDDVRKLFPEDCNGSRIILTTRLSDVAAYADSSPHEMRLMDESKSWDLLRQKLFSNKRIAVLSDKLEKIGREIARSCRGLPLAVIVVAGILSSISETPASWKKIATHIQKATSKDNRMEEIVSLGYNHLPHRLRACLLYMGLLPEDYSIRVSLLVKLWIAEGFLKHPDDDSSKSLEADAEEHLEDLVRRNLILVTGRKYNGRIKRCSLHDMVRETCIRLLDEEKHLRHIVTAEEDNQGCVMSKRSLLRFGYPDMKCPFMRFRLLRVLHVPTFEYNSRKMLKLYHLRHLCFYRQAMRLPADISHFQNLQSLIIEYSGEIFQFPSSIWKLRQLRHIIVCRGWLPSPDASSALENLQTLKEVVMNEMDEASLLLQRLPNLIELGLVLDANLNDSLVCLRQLEQLKISSWNSKTPKHFSPVIPGWLKKLTLKKCRVSVSLLESIGSLLNLEMLKLIECVFDDATWEVRGGEFPMLKMLQLTELEEIKTFIVEDAGSSAFPMLNCLRIYRCYHLVELSDEIGDIPTLELIELSRCGKGVCDWASRVQENQESYGNETLQVRCIRPEPGMLPRRPDETLKEDFNAMVALLSRSDSTTEASDDHEELQASKSVNEFIKLLDATRKYQVSV